MRSLKKVLSVIIIVSLVIQVGIINPLVINAETTDAPDFVFEGESYTGSDGWSYHADSMYKKNEQNNIFTNLSKMEAHITGDDLPWAERGVWIGGLPVYGYGPDIVATYHKTTGIFIDIDLSSIQDQVRKGDIEYLALVNMINSGAKGAFGSHRGKDDMTIRVGLYNEFGGLISELESTKNVNFETTLSDVGISATNGYLKLPTNTRTIRYELETKDTDNWLNTGNCSMFSNPRLYLRDMAGPTLREIVVDCDNPIKYFVGSRSSSHKLVVIDEGDLNNVYAKFDEATFVYWDWYMNTQYYNMIDPSVSKSNTLEFYGTDGPNMDDGPNEDYVLDGGKTYRFSYYNRRWEENIDNMRLEFVDIGPTENIYNKTVYDYQKNPLQKVGTEDYSSLANVTVKCASLTNPDIIVDKNSPVINSITAEVFYLDETGNYSPASAKDGVYTAKLNDKVIFNVEFSELVDVHLNLNLSNGESTTSNRNNDYTILYECGGDEKQFHKTATYEYIVHEVFDYSSGEDLPDGLSEEEYFSQLSLKDIDMTDLKISSLKIYGEPKDIAGKSLITTLPPQTYHVNIDTKAPESDHVDENLETYVDQMTYKQNHEVYITGTDDVSNPVVVEYMWAMSDDLWDYNNGVFEGISIANTTAYVDTPIDSVTGNKVSGDNYYLHSRAIDGVMNISEITSGPYYFDNEAPKISIVDSILTSEVNISVEEDLSGLDKKYYTWYQIIEGEEDVVHVSKKELTSDTLEYPITIEDGDYRVLIEAVDLAGNIGQSSYTIQVDEQGPSVDFPSRNSDQVIEDAKVNVVIKDLSTIKECYYQWVREGDSVDQNMWQYLSPVDKTLVEYSYEIQSGDNKNGIWYLFVKGEDGGGNENTYECPTYFKFDNESPSVEFPVKGNTVARTEIDLYLTIDNEDFGYTVLYNISKESTIDFDQEVFEEYQQVGDDVRFRIDENTGESETGRYYIHAKVIDRIGNITTISSDAIHIDNTKPVGSVSVNNAYSDSDKAQLTIEMSDIRPQASPLDVMMRISDNGGSTWGEWVPFSNSAEITVDVEGSYVFGVEFVDVAGNLSDMYTCEFVYDITPPQIHKFDFDPGWTNQDLPVTISFIDATESEDITIRVITEETDADVKIVNNKIIFATNGVCSFEYSDLAGNSNSDKVTISNIDKIKPEVTILPNGQEVKTKVLAADVTSLDNQSGSQDIELMYSWSMDPVTQPSDWTLVENNLVEKNSGDGTWYLWVKASDESGNTELVCSHGFSLDNTKPEVSQVKYSPTTVTANDVVVHIDYGESVKILSPSLTEIYSESYEYRVSENGITAIEFEDKAGNINTYDIEVDWIDRSLPSAIETLSPDTWTNDSVSTVITVRESDHALYNFVPYINGERIVIIADPDDSQAVEAAHNWNNDTNEVLLSGMDYTTTTSSAIMLTNVVVNDTGAVTQAEFSMKENCVMNYQVIRLDTEVSGNGQIVIDKIDKTPPIASAVYTTKKGTWKDSNNPLWTNEDIEVMIKLVDDSGQPVEITNNEGSNKYTFSKNGSFDFKFVDQAGNTGSYTVSATSIDRVAPLANLIYTAGDQTWYSPASESWTNQDVVVNITSGDNSGEPVKITNNGGSNTYTFTDNGAFEFTISDAAGNTSKLNAEVNKIDKIKPNPIISYTTQDWTNSPVEVSIDFNNESQPVTITNNNGLNTYWFSENASFTFDYSDIAGNSDSITISVNNIDKKQPEIESIWYSTEKLTNGIVNVKVYTDEYVTFIDGSGNGYMSFEDNGSYEFVFEDRAGNTNSKLVSVDNIDRIMPNAQLEYSTKAATREAVVVSVKADEPLYILNNYGRDQYIFVENGEFTFEYSDLAGNFEQKTASVDYIDSSAPTITLEYSQVDPTQNNVVVTVISDKTIIPVNYVGDQITYTENGLDWYKALDEFGDEFYFQVEVDNIDRSEPEIEYLNTENLVIELNGSYDLLSDLIVTDNIDEAISDKLVVTHNIDVSQPGEYVITYQATDTAGNTMNISRKAIVIDGDQFAIFVNGSEALTREIVTKAQAIRLEYFGIEGIYSVKWLDGKQTKGDFKGCETYIEDGYLEIERSGFKSILIQDQERKTKLLNVYVILSQ